MGEALPCGPPAGMSRPEHGRIEEIGSRARRNAAAIRYTAVRYPEIGQ